MNSIEIVSAEGQDLHKSMKLLESFTNGTHSEYWHFAETLLTKTLLIKFSTELGLWMILEIHFVTIQGNSNSNCNNFSYFM